MLPGRRTVATTRPPGLRVEGTFGPTASIRPRFSWPMIRKSSPAGASPNSAASISRSVPHSPTRIIVDEDAAAAGDVVDRRPGHVADVHRVGLAGVDRDGPDRRAAHLPRPDQRPRRDAVAPDEPDRQAEELDRPGIDLAEVDALEDRDARAQQRLVRPDRAPERGDAQVVDPDEPDAAPRELRRRALVEAHERRREAGLVPERGVPRLEQQPRRVGRDRQARQLCRCDHRPVDARRVDDPGRPHPGLERDRLARRGAVDEVDRGVEMGSRVDAHVDAAHVADRAALDREGPREVERRVALEDRDPRSQRDADVDPALVEGSSGVGHRAILPRLVAFTSFHAPSRGLPTCIRCSTAARPQGGQRR